MERHLFILVSLLGLSFTSIAATPQEEERFIAASKAALNAKDVKGFMALHYLAGVPEDAKKQQIEILGMMLPANPPVATIKLIDRKDAQATQKELDDLKIRFPLPITKYLHVEFAAPTAQISSLTIPVVEHQGKLFMGFGTPEE